MEGIKIIATGSNSRAYVDGPKFEVICSKCNKIGWAYITTTQGGATFICKHCPLPSISIGVKP